METNEDGKKKKTPKKQLKKYSAAYLRLREKANAKKESFLITRLMNKENLNGLRIRSTTEKVKTK